MRRWWVFLVWRAFLVGWILLVGWPLVRLLVGKWPPVEFGFFIRIGDGGRERSLGDIGGRNHFLVGGGGVFQGLSCGKKHSCEKKEKKVFEKHRGFLIEFCLLGTSYFVAFYSNRLDGVIVLPLMR